MRHFGLGGILSHDGWKYLNSLLKSRMKSVHSLILRRQEELKP